MKQSWITWAWTVAVAFGLGGAAMAALHAGTRPAPVPSAVVVVAEPLPSVAPPPPRELDSGRVTDPSEGAAPWTDLDLQDLAGTWVDEEHGDALVRGGLIPLGVRAIFVEAKPGSKTPWNLELWAPRQGHMMATNVSLGCGFYRQLHPGETGGDAPFRRAFCRGYGLAPGDSHATTIRLEKRKEGDAIVAIRVRIGSIIDEVLVRQ